MRLSERGSERLAFLKDLMMPGPYRCFLCSREAEISGDGLCDACRHAIRYLPNPVFLPPLDGVTVGLCYTPPVAAAILRYKSSGMTEYAPFLSQFLSVPESWQADILVPVPVHPWKEVLRGFHHTALLCAHLSAAAGIPYSKELLRKTRFTGEQKRQENPAERRRNIRGSFEADPRVKGLRIVLVDDVFTTGATVYECAKTLKRKGADKVFLAAVSAPPR